MTNSTIKPQERAKCPMCQKDMVYAGIAFEEHVIWVWVCNCRSQPDFLLADIENARLVPEMSLAYEMEIADECTGTGD